ncbi:hypothetical protein L6164_029937 [Bauhinia variegata]|uniref:Uncharacterized protein n=1 Tax=Bauhinia variegata TaxID=167791 RepID=A0ACB9LB46_BAUVA|nr:hypothetical protein L6164_029937 [Bauhinia variegata]
MPTTYSSSVNRLGSNLILDHLASSDCEIEAIREADANSDCASNLIVQSAAAQGSFTFGVEAGVLAVLDAGCRCCCTFSKDDLPV